MESEVKQEKVSTLSINIKSVGALYGAYMSFLNNKGLFIPTRHPYLLGDRLRLRLELMNEATIFQVMGKVVWITPGAAQGNRSSGVGVEFVDGDTVAVVELIERELAGLLDTENPTHTM